MTLLPLSSLIGYIVLGLVAGFASGCFGIGGGAIIVPCLMIFFGVPYHIAVGTSLALILPIAFAGSAANFSMQKIDWRIFWTCALTGMIGAAIGAYFIQKIDALYAKRAFALFLLYTAYRLWQK
jgi:uncharacterized membrane protein YfcA